MSAPETGHAAAEDDGRVWAVLPDLLEPVALHVHQGDGVHHAEAHQEDVRLPVGQRSHHVVGWRPARVPNGESHPAQIRTDPLPHVELVEAGGLVGGGTVCGIGALDEALYEGGFAGLEVPHHDDPHLLLLATHSLTYPFISDS